MEGHARGDIISAFMCSAKGVMCGRGVGEGRWEMRGHVGACKRTTEHRAGENAGEESLQPNFRLKE